MKSKSTLQTFRDLPNYPVIVTRVVGVLHLILGLMNLIPGLAILSLLLKNEQLTAALHGLALYTGQDPFVLGVSVIGTGGLLTFFGLASLWVAFGNFTARRSVWFTTIWLTALYVLGWITGMSGGVTVLQLLLIILTAPTVLAYIFDNRIKAYFQRGKLSEQYHQWKQAVWLGRPATATPWEYVVEERKPLLSTDKPL